MTTRELGFGDFRWEDPLVLHLLMKFMRQLFYLGRFLQ
jgi:hypothetical protein